MLFILLQAVSRFRLDRSAAELTLNSTMARRSLRNLVFSMLLPAALAATACSAPPSAGEQVGSGETPILGGTVDTEHRHVFMLVASFERYYTACTATLIAPNLLLTARHCVSASEDETVICGRSDLGIPLAATNLRASNAVNVEEATRWYEGASVHVPQEGSDTCGYDVALLVLTDNVPPSVAIPAVPRIDQEVAQGEPYVAVGYGLDEAGEQGGRLSRDGLFVSCAPGECGRIAPAAEFIGDTGVCQGDSGGPAFDVDGKVVGIVSRGGEDCSLPIYGSVGAWAGLIRNVALQAALRGNYAAPFWATTGESDPPPPSVVEAGAACGADRLCGEGHVCHAGAEGPATCAATCASEQDCARGFACEPAGAGTERSVCMPAAPPPADGPRSTCAFHPATRSGGAPLFLLALMVGWAWRSALRRADHRRHLRLPVEPRGIDPLTSALRTRRSPS